MTRLALPALATLLLGALPLQAQASVANTCNGSLRAPYVMAGVPVPGVLRFGVTLTNITDRTLQVTIRMDPVPGVTMSPPTTLTINGAGGSAAHALGEAPSGSRIPATTVAAAMRITCVG